MDEQTTGVEQSAQQEETPNVQESEGESPTPQEDDELPSEPDKQREAFIKMRQELRDLKKSKEEKSSSLDDIELPEELVSGLSEQITPDTNVNTIINQLEFTKKAAIEAMRETQQLRQEREFADTFKEFPQLDPNSETFDPNFDRLVADKYHLLIRQGERISPVEAARQVNASISALIAKTREQATEETRESIAKKEQVTLEATGNAAQGARDKVYPQNDKIEALRDRVRRGDVDAQIEYDKILFG